MKISWTCCPFLPFPYGERRMNTDSHCHSSLKKEMEESHIVSSLFQENSQSVLPTILAFLSNSDRACLMRVNRQTYDTVYEQVPYFSTFSFSRHAFPSSSPSCLCSLYPFVSRMKSLQTFEIRHLLPCHLRPIGQSLRSTCLEEFRCPSNQLEDVGLLYFRNILIRNGKTLRVLQLSRNFLGREGIRLLSSFLPFLIHLEELDLSHNKICEVSVPLLMDGLQPLKEMRALNLEQNQIGIRGARRIGLWLNGSSKIETVNLTSNRLQPEGLYECLASIRTPCALRHFSISWNEVDREGLVSVLEGLHRRFPRLEYLDLSWNNIGNTFLTLETSHVSYPQEISLRSLDLSWNFIGFANVECLCRPLMSMVHLEFLSLSWCQLGLPHIESLATSFCALKRLKRCILSWNRLDLPCCEWLSESLYCANPKLEYLDLSWNAIECKNEVYDLFLLFLHLRLEL